jgi:DNA mismatch repair protein MutS
MTRTEPVAFESPRRFESILFDAGEQAEPEVREPPEFFADVNLDQVLESLLAGREEYDLAPFFYSQLHSERAVAYRHEVLRDLEQQDVRATITRFAERMARMREHLAQIEALRHVLQKQAWFLDAVGIHCEAVEALASELADLDVASRGISGLRDYVRAYTDSDDFAALAAETRALKADLAEVDYAVRIYGSRVTVSRYGGEPDYGSQVEKTFAKFKQGSVKSYLVRLPDPPDMDHVEAQVAERVAQLYPEVFRSLADYCARRAGYLDVTISRFDREVQFYLAYLELIGRFRDAGLPFCYPLVSTESKEVAARDTFDIALANKLVREGGEVVCNDFGLEDPERIFVVTGPNNGGKTTFARMFGQLHHLASLGLLVPGREARLFLPDRIFSHFEREEDIETLRGKLDDELVRVREILERASENSLIVMNESFSSTSLDDALFLGARVLEQVIEVGALAVYVTFVDELASLGEATVSMVAQIVPENPAERTFKLLRQPADGLAYAWAIAEKYGLTYERLRARIPA